MMETAQLVADLNSRGINLHLQNGKLVYETTKPVPRGIQTTIDVLEPQLVRYLNSQPTDPPTEESRPEAPIHCETTEPTHLFPQGEPVGDDPVAYLRDVVLPHMARLSERPSPRLAYEVAILELANTYPEDEQEALYEHLTAHLPDGTPTARPCDNQLRLHALAVHGHAADCGKRTLQVWQQVATTALRDYRTHRMKP